MAMLGFYFGEIDNAIAGYMSCVRKPEHMTEWNPLAIGMIFPEIVYQGHCEFPRLSENFTICSINQGCTGMGMRNHIAPIGLSTIIFMLSLLATGRTAAQSAMLPIGEIQGTIDVSPYLNRFVNFRGVVVGRYEDENTRGDVYYTLYIQDTPDAADDDPATSDGIAVFLGRDPRPDIAPGDRVRVGGKVTEFYGLTEIDDKGLVLSIEEPGGTLPVPTIIDPPADMDAQLAYFEALEGMRVAFRDEAVVAGPTHSGCGFAVIDAAATAELPVIRRFDDDPIGRVVPVLYPSDRQCDDIPQVKTGDGLTGLEGALTYNFDQFKIIIDSADGLTITPAEMPVAPTLPPVGPAQIVIASLNLKDYFDTVRDTNEQGEPVWTADELLARQTKLAHVIADVLNCPTLLAMQEVEHEALLVDLAAELREECGFTYQVSHIESPDARGIDNALISDPRHVTVDDLALRQTCSPVPTEIADPTIRCEGGQEPLFGRPPLEILTHIDGRPTTIFVNHFKSKRGGEVETDLQRIRQAVFLNGLATEMLTTDPSARIVALGDFNDTDLSPTLALLTDPAQGGHFTNALANIPSDERYTYNFGGVVELIDAILLSPVLMEEINQATILHINTDFPIAWSLDTSPERLAFRVSDHDVPVVVLGQPPEPTVEPLPTSTPTPAPSPTPSPEAEQPTAPATEPTAEATTEFAPTAAADISLSEPHPATGQTASHWLILAIGGILVLFMAIVFIRSRR